MTIDWFTFIAQIVNFLILVGLLRWLLYAPIVRAMTQREQKIADRLNSALETQTAAEKTMEDYQEKSRRLDDEHQQLMKEYRIQAHAEYEKLLKEAKGDVESHRANWHSEFQREQEEVLSDLRRQVGHMGLETARRTLKELADAELEQRLCTVFVSRIEQLSDQQRQEIMRNMNNGESKIVIRSAFELPTTQREILRNLIQNTFASTEEVRFEQSKELVCGIEVDVGGYSISWNINDFLSELGLKVSERLRHDK